MNTQTHILIACTLFAKPGRENRTRNWAAFIGGLLPDLVIFIMFGWSKLLGVAEREVWSKWYFDSNWTYWIDAANSIPLFLLILGLGWLIGYRQQNSKVAIALIILALAALIHLMCDLPLHVDDGHAHFWPFTHWRYVSAVSYWDSNHYGHIVSIMEIFLGLTLSIILWRRFTALWIKLLLSLCILSYIAVPLYFILQFG